MNTSTRSESDARLAELRAEAKYAGERYELYRARTYGPRPTSATRLRELERRSTGAEARLAQARAERNQT